MNEELEPVAKRAVYHLLTVMAQYMTGRAGRDDYFVHSYMRAGQDAAAFLEELGLGSCGDGYGFLLNEKGKAIANDDSLR